jgi:thiamine pyrophosphokinase
MSKFVIFLSGDVTPTKRLRKQIDGAFVIAADGGIAHAEAFGLMPKLWVGDFDSSTAQHAKDYAHVPRINFPAEKDATDGELAIAEAMRLGATELILVGAFGGQFDHALAHVGFLVGLARRGMKVFITSGHEEAHALVEDLEFSDLDVGTRISIVPLTDLKALTLAGVKWPLNRRDVPLGSALTLSNIVTGAVDIALRAGSAVVIFYPK